MDRKYQLMCHSLLFCGRQSTLTSVRGSSFKSFRNCVPPVGWLEPFIDGIVVWWGWCTMHSHTEADNIISRWLFCPDEFRTDSSEPRDIHFLCVCFVRQYFRSQYRLDSSLEFLFLSLVRRREAQNNGKCTVAVCVCDVGNQRCISVIIMAAAEHCRRRRCDFFRLWKSQSTRDTKRK